VQAAFLDLRHGIAKREGHARQFLVRVIGDVQCNGARIGRFLNLADDVGLARIALNNSSCKCEADLFSLKIARFFFVRVAVGFGGAVIEREVRAIGLGKNDRNAAEARCLQG
jgi:hypothetical protein